MTIFDNDASMGCFWVCLFVIAIDHYSEPFGAMRTDLNCLFDIGGA